MKLFAVILTVVILTVVILTVPVTVAGLAPQGLADGKAAASLLVVSESVPSDCSTELTTGFAPPDVTAPTCAKPGAKSRLWPVGSTPYGRSYIEWSQDWWRWALSIPAAINPILDATGDSCAYGQHGPVWFLAGSFGQTLERNCSVPCNKAIFLPIVNSEWENAWVDQPILSIAELRALVASAGTPTTATLEVDGRALDVGGNRVISNLFDYSFGPDNIGGQPAGVYFPTVSDGIWAMLDPLPPGPHTVRFTASMAPFFFLDVTYHLDVVALELPCSSPPCQ